MASTNFLVFDEGKQNMMSDGDYSANTQRARGVTPGIAYPNLHNKLYYQVSVMAKAIADFMVAQGANASDEDVEQLTADISTAFTNFVDNKTKDVYLPLSGGTMKGNINANGYNITATKFIGNLQGKADSAANADLATKANQDSQGQVINTTYIKSITASNATLTVTKGNGTTSTVTINNVAHATKADDATNAGNINKGYAEYAEKFPADTFRNDVLGREGNGFALRPFYCLLPNGKYGSSPGVGFGSIDTQGFLQVAYNAPIAYVGAGNEGKIKWSKQLAFTDSPTLTGTPTAPTQNTSDNSTRIATTAFVKSFVKSLFTASKATNGWRKDGNTGIIYQWGVNSMNSTSKSFNFNISFPNSCFIVRAGDAGIDARSVGSSANNNTSFTIYVGNSQPLQFSWFAIGY